MCYILNHESKENMNTKNKFISMSAWRKLGFEKVEDRVYIDKDMKYYIEPLMAPGIGTGQLILIGKKKPIIKSNETEDEKEC